MAMRETAVENISHRHELSNLHWPQRPTTKNSTQIFSHASVGPSVFPRNKNFLFKAAFKSNPHPAPSQIDAAAVASAPTASSPRIRSLARLRLHGRLRRIRQCLRRRRRRARMLLLHPARHPEERIRHRRARRLPEARHEVAPGPVGERPRRGWRGQSAVPEDPGGVLRFVR